MKLIINADDFGLNKSITSYINREEELKILKEAKLSGIFDEIELISFKEF